MCLFEIPIHIMAEIRPHFNLPSNRLPLISRGLKDWESGREERRRSSGLIVYILPAPSILACSSPRVLLGSEVRCCQSCAHTSMVSWNDLPFHVSLELLVTPLPAPVPSSSLGPLPLSGLMTFYQA